MTPKFKGSVNNSVFFTASDSTTGLPKTGLVYTNMTGSYVRARGTRVAITMATLASASAAFSSGGFIEVDATNQPGLYRLDVPDAAFVTGATEVVVSLVATGCLIRPRGFNLQDVNDQDAVRMGMTALPNTACTGNASLLTSGTGTDQLSVSAGKVLLQATQTGVTIPTVTTLTNAPSDSSGTTTLLGRLTATRAGYLDNLTNLDASITSLNNLSALSNLYASPLMEIPDSGSTLFAYTLVVRDNEGKMKDLDSSPTITAANAAGTDRSANLSAVSHPATGRYTWTYSVSSSDAEESMRITASGTISAEARYNEWIGAVVNYDTLTTLAAVKAKTDLIPANPAAAGDKMDLVSTLNISGTTSIANRVAAIMLVDADANKLKVNADGSMITGGYASGQDPKSQIGMATADMDTQLSEILTAVQAIDSGAGTGIHGITVTFTDGTNSLENVTASAYLNGVLEATSHSDASGVATFNLDDGSYLVRYKLAGYEPGSTTAAVSGNGQNFPVTMDLINISASDPDFTTCYLTVFDENGAKSGVDVTLEITQFHRGDTGAGIADATVTNTTDSNGIVQFTNRPRLARYSVSVEGYAMSFDGVTANASTTPLINALGQIG